MGSRLPEGWEEKPVANVCSSVSVGIVIKPAQYYVPAAKGIRAFRSANVREGHINDSDWVFISHEGNKDNAKSILKAGDVLIVRSGYPGTACVLPEEYDGSNCIDIIFARPDKNLILPEYLCAFTNSAIGKKQVLNSQGGLAQKHLNVAAYKKLKLTLPPLPEQTKIARILSTWDRAIETTEKLIENSRQQKKALMQQLLTGKKRLPGFEGEWKSYNLGQIFTERVETGHTNLSLVSITGQNGVIPRDDSGKKDTSSSDKSKYKRIYPGDIGYNTMRMWQGVSGLSSLEGIVSPAYTIVVPKGKADALFMSCLFKLPRTVHDFYRYSQGLTSDTWNLKFRHFKKVTVTVPKEDEQRNIAEVLAKQDALLAAYQNDLARITNQKQALMQQLLTGKRRVKLD